MEEPLVWYRYYRRFSEPGGYHYHSGVCQEYPVSSVRYDKEYPREVHALSGSLYLLLQSNTARNQVFILPGFPRDRVFVANAQRQKEFLFCERGLLEREKAIGMQNLGIAGGHEIL